MIARQVKHTPGPWTVAVILNEDRIKREDMGLYEVEEAHEQILDQLESGYTDVAFAVAEANARLIAAAPDLLAACQALLPIVVDAIMHGMPITKEVAHARNIAVKAISRATSPDATEG